MIAPKFRACTSPDMTGPFHAFIEQKLGTDIWNACKDHIEGAKNIKDELTYANQFAQDPEQMEKFQNLFTKDYQNSMVYHKYFSFGHVMYQKWCDKVNV